MALAATVALDDRVGQRIAIRSLIGVHTGDPWLHLARMQWWIEALPNDDPTVREVLPDLARSAQFLAERDPAGRFDRLRHFLDRTASMRAEQVARDWLEAEIAESDREVDLLELRRVLPAGSASAQLLDARLAQLRDADPARARAESSLEQSWGRALHPVVSQLPALADAFGRLAVEERVSPHSTEPTWVVALAAAPGELRLFYPRAPLPSPALGPRGLTFLHLLYSANDDPSWHGEIRSAFADRKQRARDGGEAPSTQAALRMALIALDLWTGRREHALADLRNWCDEHPADDSLKLVLASMFATSGRMQEAADTTREMTPGAFDTSWMFSQDRQ